MAKYLKVICNFSLAGKATLILYLTSVYEEQRVLEALKTLPLQHSYVVSVAIFIFACKLQVFPDFLLRQCLSI